MPQPVGSTIDMLLNMSADTVIGALLLAVVIAAVTANSYSWLRRGKSDLTTILVALILVGNLACLVTGAGFIQWTSHSSRIGSPDRGQKNGQVSAPRRLVRPGVRWRRAASRRPARAELPANSQDPAISAD
jgi:hypothetical protein